MCLNKAYLQYASYWIVIYMVGNVIRHKEQGYIMILHVVYIIVI